MTLWKPKKRLRKKKKKQKIDHKKRYVKSAKNQQHAEVSSVAEGGEAKPSVSASNTFMLQRR